VHCRQSRRRKGLSKPFASANTRNFTGNFFFPGRCATTPLRGIVEPQVILAPEPGGSASWPASPLKSNYKPGEEQATIL
jgi:hypothetical protein